MGDTIGVTIRLQRVARADRALLVHILAHLRRRHQERVANHATVVAVLVLDHHRSQGRVDQVPGATLLANLERADQAHTEHN